VALLLAGLLAGCAMPAMPSFTPAEPAASAPPAAAVAPRPADPLASFIGSAAPGASGDVAGYGSVRLARSYTAASGRECREAMLGRGAEERAVVYCRGSQGWAPARPLLRSGTLRP
jgi:hypothetical protein